MRVGLPEYFLGNGGSNHKLVAFAERIREAERERIIRGIEDEADTTPDHEDAMVTRENALLIRADFSYEKLDELKAADPEWAFGGEAADAR